MATTTTADGVTIHYETIGSGPDLLLVHGLTDSSLTWGPVTDLLAQHYRVTTLDLRGMGRSGDSDDYDAVGMVRDLAAVVEAAGISDPLVVGHSLGGIVATAYAGVAPVRGTVNVDQTLRLGSFQAGLQSVEPMLRDPAAFPTIIQAIFSGMDGDQLTPDQVSALASHRRQRQELVLGVWNQVFHTPVAELDQQMASMTASITAPYLSLQFEEPNAAYTEWLQGLIPHAMVEYWTVPGGVLGHYGHLVQAERFVERVLAFDH
jgi:pimeloyl-ACP methyl ester carboxylesterase